MSAKLQKTDIIHPFRIMMHPVDCVIHTVCLIFFPIAAVYRFGWLDGGMLAAGLLLLIPPIPRVPVPPSDSGGGT